MNGLRDILGIFLRLLQSFYHLPFRFEPVFGKTADGKAIIYYHPLVQTAKKPLSVIMSNLNMSQLHDS